MVLETRVIVTLGWYLGKAIREGAFFVPLVFLSFI